jgi:hypothetical protein
MTDLQRMRHNLMASGLSCNAAVQTIARRTGIDPDSVRRALKSADEADNRD